jgi:hypothetical protein
MQVSQKLKWGGDGDGDVVRFPEILAPIPLRSGSIPGSQLIPRPALSLSSHDQLRPRLNANGHLSRTSRSPDMILEMCPVYPTGRNTLLQVAFVSCSPCTHGIRQLRNRVSWRPPILQR